MTGRRWILCLTSMAIASYRLRVVTIEMVMTYYTTITKTTDTNIINKVTYYLHTVTNYRVHPIVYRLQLHDEDCVVNTVCTRHSALSHVPLGINLLVYRVTLGNLITAPWQCRNTEHIQPLAYPKRFLAFRKGESTNTFSFSWISALHTMIIFLSLRDYSLWHYVHVRQWYSRQ